MNLRSSVSCLWLALTLGATAVELGCSSDPCCEVSESGGASTGSQSSGGSSQPVGGAPGLGGGPALGGTGGATAAGGNVSSGGGAAGGGAPGGGASATGGGSGETGGDSSGGSASGGGGSGPIFECPDGASELSPTLGAASKLLDPPPNPPGISGSTFFLEGPVYLGGKLYFSQFRDYAEQNQPSPGRIMAFDGQSAIEVAADSGTNGLALAGPNLLYAASQKVGGLVSVDLSTNPVTLTTLVADYMGSRLNSPNDLTIGSDGTVYLSDPDWNCASPCSQTENRVYRYPPSGDRKLIEIPTDHAKPNGLTLSPDFKTLYIGGDANLVSLPVMTDGSVGAATPFGSLSGVDGMGVDCAGNLYAAVGGDITVLSPTGAPLGTITVAGDTTNVAFGGPGNTTLYITTLREGIFSLDVKIPGFPY